MLPANLSAWLRYLEQLHPNSIDLGLERIHTVAQRLGLVQPRATVITVAGTNGKGSTVHLLSSALRYSGARVGQYTSPHLFVFNERIQIDGHAVAANEICACFAQIERVRAGVSLTYFEFTTLAAFLLLQEQALDFWVLEIGMGGRLDAVNLMAPDIAIITSLGLDHTEWLGPDLEAIGYEKAGIIRPHIPVVLGLSPEEIPQSVQRVLVDKAAVSYARGQEYDFTQEAEGSWQWQSGAYQVQSLITPRLPVPAVALTLMTLALLAQQQKVKWRTEWGDRLATCQLAGRFEIHREAGMTTVYDVAHNAQAVQMLRSNLLRQPCTGRTYVVLGMLQNKKPEQSLASLQGLVEHWFCATLAVPRGLTAHNLANKLRQFLTTADVVSCWDTVLEAKKQAFACAEPNDSIVFMGSFYTVAAALSGKKRPSKKEFCLTQEKEC